jgi:hypothetical protein
MWKINMDKRTSFEGYRTGDPRFLTMKSQEEDDILDEYSVKDFLKSKNLSRAMIS